MTVNAPPTVVAPPTLIFCSNLDDSANLVAPVNVDIGGDLTFDEVNARNLTITGIATLGFATAANAYVAGITTSSLLHVGMGATMVKVQGTPATRVGINSVGPAYTLDVDGDINSTGTIRQAGTSVLTTASGDATALAIALG